MATVMSIQVQITGVSSGLTKAVQSSNTSLNSLGSTATKTGGIMSKLGSLGLPLQAGLGLAVFQIGKTFIQAGIESEQMNAQTVAGLQSTGNAANVTLGDVQGLANGILSYSGISDEAVQSGENMLLTFTNIQNGVGASNQIFDQATVALADMATKMSGGVTPSADAMSSTAIKLGKALNNPIAGMTALSRVGVQFTEEQKSQIQTMVETGNVMGAQKVILGELTTEFGGSAKAMGSTFIGQWNIMKETVMNVVEGIVVAVFKIVGPVLQVVASLIQLASAAGVLVPLIIGLAVAWGIYSIAASVAAAAGVTAMTPLAPILLVVGAAILVIVGLFKLVQAGMSALSGGWSKMGGVMKAVLIVLAPLWLPIVAAIKLVVAVFNVLKGAVMSIWNAVKSFITGWISGLQSVGKWIGDQISQTKALAMEVAHSIPIVSQLMQIFSAIGDTAKANAAAAASGFRTMGLQVLSATMSSDQGFKNMMVSLGNVKAALMATDPAKWAAMFKQGIATTDAALKSGAITADQAQRAYMAWGMSTANAAKRVQTAANVAKQASTIVANSSQIMSGAMTKLGNAGKLTEQKLVKAFNASAKAAMKLAQNSNIVAQRFQQSTGMTAEESKKLVTDLQSEFGDKAPQIMSLLAKSSGKNFSSMAKNILTGREGFADFGKEVTNTGKVSTQAVSGQKKLGDETKQTGDAASDATKDTTSLGNSVQSGQSKVAGMTTNVAKLGTELNNLPSSVRIEVTVNITKTGAALGGVVPGLAGGGMVKAPLTMVGERGPELAALPAGTRVFSNVDTMGMIRKVMGAGAGAAAGGAQKIVGKLSLVNGAAYIEGVVIDTLDDGRLMNDVLSRAMVKP